MYPTKKLWEIVKISKWKKVNYQDENWKYNYIDIWILRTWKVEQFTNDEWVFCKKEDILIAWDGSKSGTVGFWLEWVIGSTLAKITIDTKMFSSEFIGKFLQGNFDYLNKNTSGAAIPHLRKDILINLEIPLPPLPTQQKIVAKLDSLFEKLDQATTLTKQNLANIEELNKSVLEKIFKECEEKYEKRKLGEVCNKITDWSHNPPKWIETWYPMISARNLTDFNEIIFDNLRFLSENDYLLENKRTDVKDWDILLSIVWTIWKVCIVKEKYWKFVMQRSLAVLKLNKNLLNSKFVYFYLKSDFAQKFLNNSANWATQKWIYLKDLKQIIIPLPPLSEQQKIVEYLDNIFAENQKLKNLYQAQIKNLDEMKQSFLKKAFAGELV